MISKTTNIAVKILAEISQEMGELRTTALQNRITIHYLLLKHNLGCQQLPATWDLNMSDFSHIVIGQISDLRKEINCLCWTALKSRP